MKLFDYQEKIFNKIKNKDSVALFMEAGTGKTILSNEKLKDLNLPYCLIVCLASKVDEWEEDCNKFFKGSKSICTLNKGFKKNKELLKEQHNIYIISFQSLLLIRDNMFKAINETWMIIIDESQFIKNYKSKISKTCHKLSTKTPYKMILTGTPQNKGYIDYFSQLKFLGTFNVLRNFQKEFCIMETVRYGSAISFVDIVGYKNTQKLDKIINDNAIFFKRDRSIEELPEQKYINFQPNTFYKKFMKDRVYEDVVCPNKGVLRMRLRQLCGGSLNEHRFKSKKEDWIKEFIENTYTRIVIFHNFDEEWHILEEIAKKLKRPVSIYNGKVKDIDNFKNCDDAILIVNYGSGGTGINWLKTAHVGVFYSPPESYLNFEQARKRLDRIGQEHRPMLYCLRTLKSVEEKIYESIEKKEDFDDKKFRDYLESEEVIK